MKVISAVWWWLVVQSTRSVRGHSWERTCVLSWPSLGFRKVGDGPKPLVHCSDLASVFLAHVVRAVMLALLGDRSHAAAGTQ